MFLLKVYIIETISEKISNINCKFVITQLRAAFTCLTCSDVYSLLWSRFNQLMDRSSHGWTQLSNLLNERRRVCHNISYDVKSRTFFSILLDQNKKFLGQTNFPKYFWINFVPIVYLQSVHILHTWVLLVLETKRAISRK